jgi:glutaredoxin/uncharacterized protein (UPF0333 family)
MKKIFNKILGKIKFNKIKFDKDFAINAVIVVVLIAVGVMIYLNYAKLGGKTKFLSATQAGQKAVDYVNNNFLKDKTDMASFKESKEESGMYIVKFMYQGQENEVYVTRDGRLMFPVMPESGIPTVMDNEGKESGKTVDLNVPKRDKPDFKLFVMSYCPYGLQAEKAFLPVYNLLKGKADMNINFVDYAMHEKKELDENLKQYCIQKNEKEKYYNYLSCFVGSGNYEKCLTDAKIDNVKLATCTSQIDQQYKITEMYNDKNTWVGQTCPEAPYCFPKFSVEEDLNQQYGVGGSPVIIINDTEVSLGRSPEEFKTAICSAFNNPPAECSQKLSEIAATSGFGEGASSGDDQGGCGN